MSIQQPHQEWAVEPGLPHPLGATWRADGPLRGVNFALYSAHAAAVHLCLYDASGREEIARIPVRARSGHVWHCLLPQARPGQLYGYRLEGPSDPRRGHMFNPAKLLIDPYARDLVGELYWQDVLYGFRLGAGSEWAPDVRDSQHAMPRCRVIDPAFDWEDDRPPRTAWQDTVIYELHVRGFTMAHPQVPQEQRGTYLGLASPPVLAYLCDLGVTAVELMPCARILSERHLAGRGLRNYWGYNPLAFFAPEPRYALTDPLREFKTMVKRLHAAGLEVIIDVVYNHTAEGNEYGPTLSLRGIDNVSYYELMPDDAHHSVRYVNNSGCGNSLRVEHPQMLKLVMDCLRYWVQELHVDGFRFDLAPSMAREGGSFEPGAAFLDAVHQDPVLARVKLIAEPWDVGPDGYRLGGFPGPWAEWNDRYRDTLRAFWRGDGGMIGTLAERIAGSSDLFHRDGRTPSASINFVTSHDGFTLHDLVSYRHKRNQANLEGNRDGHDHNLSFNCGHEGPSGDPAVRALRARQKRNLLATLLLSQGTPMLLAGDELGRTQLGNNNAYCQDNEVSWQRWDGAGVDLELRDFLRYLLRLRAAHPVFRRLRFLSGRPGADGHKDVAWLNADGQEMDGDDWQDWHRRELAVLLSGELSDTRAAREGIARDSDFLLLLNAGAEGRDFLLPSPPAGGAWRVLLDTAAATQPPRQEDLVLPARYGLSAYSLVLLEAR